MSYYENGPHCASYCRTRSQRFGNGSEFDPIKLPKTDTRSPEWKVFDNELDKLINSDAGPDEIMRLLGYEPKPPTKAYTGKPITKPT